VKQMGAFPDDVPLRRWAGFVAFGGSNIAHNSAE